MNGVILYKSKYGATRQYADWLADATGFRLVEAGAVKSEDFASCDAVIFGGGIYASGIAGLPILKKNMDLLAGKKVLAFCVGASPFDKTAFQGIVQQNMKDELSSIPLFYCRGAWAPDKMSFKDRALCKMLRKMVAKKEPAACEPWMAALLQAGDSQCDWTDKRYLEPILSALQ